eukprot:5326280-Prymnesium_polylepis.1
MCGVRHVCATAWPRARPIPCGDSVGGAGECAGGGLRERLARAKVEEILEGAPQLDRVAALALVVEAVYPVDRRALVVAAQQPHLVGVLDLERHQQEHALETVRPAVDVIAEEEVARVGRQPLELEEPQQVEELPMYVTHDLQRRAELEQHRLRADHLLGASDERCGLLIAERDARPRPLALDGEQLLDDGVAHGGH